MGTARRLKRFLCFIIMVAFSVQSFPMYAYAQTTQHIEASEHTEQDHNKNFEQNTMDTSTKQESNQESNQEATSDDAKPDITTKPDSSTTIDDVITEQTPTTVTDQISTEKPEGTTGEGAEDSGSSEEAASKEEASSKEEEETGKEATNEEELSTIEGVSTELSTETSSEVSTEELEPAILDVDVDISKDLNISYGSEMVSTPTMEEGSYDTDISMEDYIPGKDASANNLVSKGQEVAYTLSFSMESKTGIPYNVNELYIESVDDEGNKMLSTTPIYKLNESDDVYDITDDGSNVETGLKAILQSVVMKDGEDTGDGFSTGTYSSQIRVRITNPDNQNFNDAIYWKNKVAPKIRIVAVKDGIEVKSDIIELPTVNLTSNALLNHYIRLNANDWEHAYQERIEGATRIYFPIIFGTGKQFVKNQYKLLDNPKFDTISYKAKVDAYVNNTAIPLTADNFRIDSLKYLKDGVLQYENGILTISGVPSGDYNDGLNYLNEIFSSIILDIPDQESLLATVKVDISYLPEEGIVYNNSNGYNPENKDRFSNGYLFDEILTSNTNSKQLVVKINPNGPEAESVHIKNSITSPVEGSFITTDPITQILEYSNADFLQLQDSMIVQVVGVKKDIYFFDNNAEVRINYQGIDGNTKEASNVDYEVLYGHINYEEFSKKNLNKLNQLNDMINDGTVALGAYDDIEKPNIKAIVFHSEPSMPDVDTTKNIQVKITGSALQRDSNENIAIANPVLTTGSSNYLFAGKLFSYMSMKTNLPSTEEAVNQYGKLLSSADSFQSIDGAVYLNLGCYYLKNGTAIDVADRFNDISDIKVDLPFRTDSERLKFEIHEAGCVLNDQGITFMEDYSKEYLLSLTKNGDWMGGGATRISKGTKIKYTIPLGEYEQIVNFDKLSGKPFVMSYNLKGGKDKLEKIAITEFNYRVSGREGIIEFTMPENVLLKADGRAANSLVSGIFFPIRFKLPTVSNYVLDPGMIALEYEKSNFTFVPAIGSENYILNGIDINSNFYPLRIESKAIALTTPQNDDISLKVTPANYKKNKKVSYTCTVNNFRFQKPTDYYITLSVPTQEYNRSTDNGNSSYAKGYITSVDRIKGGNKPVDIYYLSEPDVTNEDILVFKEQKTDPKADGFTCLKDFYNDTVSKPGSKWVKYVKGISLPKDVVMMIAFAPEVKLQNKVEIEYSVKMTADGEDGKTYTNWAQSRYHSGTQE